MEDKKYSVLLVLVIVSYVVSGYLYVQNRSIQDRLFLSPAVSVPIEYSKPKPPPLRILFPTIKKISGDVLIVEQPIPRGFVEDLGTIPENVDLEDLVSMEAEIRILPETAFVDGTRADLTVGMSLRIVTNESFLEVKKLTAKRIELPEKDL